VNGRMTLDEAARRSRFTFQGTVARLGASTMSSVTATPRTAVVRVDHVLEAPDALDDFTGREVTVGLASGERLQEGQQAIFYTLGLSLG
jgi:hypothetical protein